MIISFTTTILVLVTLIFLQPEIKNVYGDTASNMFLSFFLLISLLIHSLENIANNIKDKK